MSKVSNEEHLALIIKARAGDMKAYNELINCHIKLVRYIANQYYQPQKKITLEDLISEGYEALVSAINAYDINRGATYYTYVNMLITRRIITHIKKYDEPRVEDYTSEMLIDEDYLIDDNEQEEETIDIKKYLNQLSDNQQQIMIMHYGLDNESPMSFVAIGKQLNLSKQRIKQLHDTAMKRLRSIIIER